MRGNTYGSLLVVWSFPKVPMEVCIRPSCVQTPVFSGPRQPGSCMRSRGSWPGVSGICFNPLGPGGALNQNQEGNVLLQ